LPGRSHCWAATGNCSSPWHKEVGLLDAHKARLPPKLEPPASWARTGQVELADEDVRCQNW